MKHSHMIQFRVRLYDDNNINNDLPCGITTFESHRKIRNGKMFDNAIGMLKLNVLVWWRNEMAHTLEIASIRSNGKQMQGPIYTIHNGMRRN